MAFQRQDGRQYDQIRQITVQYDVYGYADASVLLEQGKTKVLVSISLQPGVPAFLKGQRTGWLSAEYSMLPSATHQRTMRESSQAQRNARSVEISRLVGRCLRPTLDLKALGERSIIIDCDVLQADGGTRVACITAASLGLKIAAQRWFSRKVTEKNIFLQQVAAVSLGIAQETVLVDLAYNEDLHADADFNFVITDRDELVEVQGTSEKKPLQWSLFDELKDLARSAAKNILQQVNASLPSSGQISQVHNFGNDADSYKQPKNAFFSLGNRVNKP